MQEGGACLSPSPSLLGSGKVFSSYVLNGSIYSANPYLLASRLSVRTALSLVRSLVGKTCPIPCRYSHTVNAGTKVHTKYNRNTRKHNLFLHGESERTGSCDGLLGSSKARELR